MFDEYLAEIRSVYDQKKNEGSLSPHLSHPTPGNLGKECINVYRERYSSSDDSILKSFFGPPDKEKGYSKIIENFRADDFRQIPKILKGTTTNPGIKFIELLAWLIDFQPRPSNLYYKQLKENKTAGNEENSIRVEEKTEEPNDQEPQTSDDGTTEKDSGPIDLLSEEQKQEQPPKPPISNRLIIITSIVLLLTGTGILFLWKYKTNTNFNSLLTSQKCMYWTGDHYEAIDCNEKISGVPVVPLNIRVLKNLRKITLPDTLTKSSIGKVWYAGRGKVKHEFFTDSGMHPVDTVKRLKPITLYTLANHVSYYRYLLTLLISSICAFVFLVLFTILVFYLRKKHKKGLLFRIH